jgi:hypothetical protein
MKIRFAAEYNLNKFSRLKYIFCLGPRLLLTQVNSEGAGRLILAVQRSQGQVLSLLTWNFSKNNKIIYELCFNPKTNTS